MAASDQLDAYRQLELPSGRLGYREAGAGPALVFVHGYLVDGRLWDRLIEVLAPRFRCICADWPLGAQRGAMKPDADLSPPGIAALISAFMGALDLDDVTIVGNDSGGAMAQVLVTGHPQRIKRLVLTNCDTHENFPPGIFKAMPALARLPGAIELLTAPFRIPAIARAAYRPFARTQIPAELITSWLQPSLTDAAVRADLRKVTIGLDKRYTLAAAEKLRKFDRPVLLAWAPDDRYFPIQYAERLAAAIPDARLVEIADSNTFIPLDQPQRLGEVIADFVAEGEPPPA